MNGLTHYLTVLRSAFMPDGWVLAACPAAGTPGHRAAWARYGKWRHPEINANSGGPRSRVVATPVVSRLLSEGSETLGFRPLGHYAMQPRFEAGNFRKLAARLLRKAGFASPDQAWDSMCDHLPGQPSMVVDAPGIPPDIAMDPSEDNLRAALVLGKCCGSLFSPARPVIWSERRLARSVSLVECDALTFTRNDDE